MVTSSLLKEKEKAGLLSKKEKVYSLSSVLRSHRKTKQCLNQGKRCFSQAFPISEIYYRNSPKTVLLHAITADMGSNFPSFDRASVKRTN